MDQTLINEHPTEYEDIMTQMKQHRYDDSELVLELGKELLRLTGCKQDDYVRAFAYLYISDAYYALGKYSHGIDYGLNGVKLQQVNQFNDLLLQQFNILGLIYINQCQESYAIEYFHKGLELAKKLNNTKLIGFITNNIGIIYAKLKDYKKAIKYYTLGYETSKIDEKNDMAAIQESAWNLNLADVYISNGNIKKAQEQLDIVKKNKSYGRLGKDETLIICLQSSIYYAQGEHEKAYESVLQGIHLIHLHRRILNYYPAAIEMLNILINIGKKETNTLGEKAFESAKVWKQACYEMASNIQVAEQWLMYYDAVIDLHEHLQEIEEWTTALSAYRKWTKEQNEIIRKYRLRGIKNRMAIEKFTKEIQEIQQKNKYLKVLSEEDPLTGVKNRYALKECVEQKLEHAKQHGNYFGLFLIDVDYFKEYNDTYGHIAGDGCLAKIAKVIESSVGEDGLVVRYGGDEFLVILENKTEVEALNIVKNIHNRVRAMKLWHKTSKASDRVSVTQGGIICVPTEGKTITDYIHSADVALYKKKATTKNDYYVTTEF